MEIFSSIVQIPAGPMLDIGQDFTLRNAVTTKTIGDETPRFVPQSSEQPLEESLGRIRVPPVLHQNVEHDAVLVHRAPEIMQSAVDPDEHFIQVPDITGSRSPPPKPAREGLAEFQTPAPDALVGDGHAPFGQA